MRSIGEILNDIGWPDKLRDLASRVDRNLPDHRDPQRFHAEKSEIVNDLRRLAREGEAVR